MAFHMGNGGNVTIASTAVNIGKWSFRKKSRLSEITHSGTSGYAKWIGTVKEGTFTFDAPWDDAALVTGLGIVEGAEATAKFYLGNSTKFFQVAIIFEDVGYECDNKEGHVSYDTAGKLNGAVTEPV